MESDLLKLEEVAKLKLARLKIELPMPFVPQELPSVKVLFQEEDLPFSMLPKL